MIKKFIFLCMAVLTQHGHAITDYIVTSVHYEPTLPTDGTQLVCSNFTPNCDGLGFSHRRGTMKFLL